MIVGRQTGKYFAANKGVSAYLSEIKRYTVPNEAEEQDLISRAKNNDDKARQELLYRNQRFIFSVAKIYAKDDNELMDYVNEGTIGLSIAIDKYDPSIGTKFMTLGVQYIRRSMHAYMTTTRNLINRSNNLKFGNKIDKIKDRFYVTQGRVPTSEEIAELLEEHYPDLKVKKIADVYDVNVTSINEEVSDDFTMEDDSEFTKRTSTTNDYERVIENDYYKEGVKKIMAALPPKKRELILKMFGVGYDREYSIGELCDEYGLTQTNIENIRNEAFEFLRTKFNRKEVL